MDFHSQKLLKGKNNSCIGEAEDRISGLPDEILHYILSFLEFKFVVRTCVLSKRWNYIWTSNPILKFPSCYRYSLSQTNKLMDFVDATLLLHDPSSNIQTIHLETNGHFDAFRVHSWISNITKRNNVRELNLDFRLDKPFSIPSSLFKCESLTTLELTASCDMHIPKSFSFPKLKSLTLCGIQFTQEDGWNEKHFSNFPVLENFILKDCTWHGMKKFCILTPVLKVLEFEKSDSKKDGLQDCVLKIHAPNPVSLSHVGGVAKDYDLSRFTGFVNILPTFHNLNNLDLILGPASDELIFALIKAVPNLKRLQFGDEVLLSADRVFDESQDLFRHLQSVGFVGFGGNARELRWAKCILKNAKSLQTINIGHGACHFENKDVVMLELSSLARASGRCLGSRQWPSASDSDARVENPPRPSVSHERIK
ncbi:F-box protein At4g09920-like [Papaver somniferum]|uniref:F-box protein At4g09920-like n=1 Tax=Papaver somniferum TaxID=3469 RepID=UPI000E6FBE2B|nr:F-box protein At4g09920-like [Papaver somniferum]